MPLSKYFCLILSTLRTIGSRERNVHHNYAELTLGCQPGYLALLVQSKTSWAKAGALSLPALSSAFPISLQTCFWAFSSSPHISSSVGWVRCVLWVCGEELQQGFMSLNFCPACSRPWLLTSDPPTLELPGGSPIAYVQLLKPFWEAIGLLDKGEGQL